MTFKDIVGEAFPIVEKFAPAIAGAIGSPAASAMSSLALNMLGNAFGIKESDHNKLSEAITSCPHCDTTLSAIEGVFSYMSNDHVFSVFDKHFPSSIEFNVKLGFSN